MTRVVGIDFFSGAGGMSLGAELAGVEVVLAIDSDPYGTKTYAANHPNTEVLTKDIRRLRSSKVKAAQHKGCPTVFFGGPPCQGFSYSNLRTRTADNPDNWLFKDFLRAVRACRPEWVVFENVIGIVNTAGGIFVDHVEEALFRLGYATTKGVLNANDFGVPQDRARFFLIGSRTGVAPRLPTSLRRKATTVSDAIRDLPKLENGAAVSWMKYGRKQPSKYARSMRNGSARSPNHLVTKNSELVIRRYGHIPQGGNWEDIPDHLMSNYADRHRCHTGIYHRLRNSSPSVVIGNYRKNMLIHPTQDRGLSVREAARIQSFPDDYEFHGSIGFQQQQVGNAVPPLLARSVFATIVSVYA